MKNLIKRLKRQAQAYIDFRAQPAADINLKTHKIITTIKEAQEKQLALHAIYKDGSFTGDLVKYDPKNNKLNPQKLPKEYLNNHRYQRYQSFDIGTTNCP